MITFSEHSIIIRIKNQASEALEQINGSITKMLAKIDDHREGIQAVGTIAGVAFAGLSFGMKRAVDESAKVENALIGLESIVVATGGSFDATKKKVQEFTQDGLLGIDEASTALKNLLARGYNQDEAFAVMGRLKDAASYGRQAGFGLGEAVVTATEGLKNENSVLVDNAGVTKNVAKMWEEYAKSVGKSTKDLTAHEKIQAEIAGIMKETQFQVGNAEKISKTYSGTVSRLTGSISTMFASLGDTIKPVLNNFLQSVEPIVAKITEWIQLNPELAGKIAMVATTLTGLIAGASGLALALGPMYSGLKLVGAVVGGLVSPIGLVVAAITAFGVAYTTNFMGFKDVVDGVVNFFAGVPAKVSEIFKKIKGYFEDFKKRIVEKFVEIQKFLGEFWDNFGESIQVAVGAIVGLFIPSIIKTGVAIGKLTVQTGIELAKAAAHWVIMGAKKMAVATMIMVQAIGGMISSLVKFTITTAVQTGKIIASWVLMGSKALIAGAKMAAAWVTAMGPIAWVTAAVVAIGVLIYQNWEKIVENTKQTWETFVNIIIEAWNATIDWLVKLGEKIMGIISGIWTTLKEVTMFLWEGIISFFVQTLERLLQMVRGFGEFFGNLWRGIWERMKNIVGMAWEGIKGVVTGVASAINEWVKNVFGVDLGAVFTEVWEGAKNIASGAIEALDGFVRPILQGLVEFVQSLIGGIQAAWDKAKAVARWVKDAPGRAWDTVTGTQTVSRVSGGHRRHGGEVYAGRQYVVGEGGAELFVPATNGYIVPNNQLGGNTININMGGVVVQNEADENRLAQKIKETLYREMRLARLGF